MVAPLRILLVSSTLDDDGGIPVCVAQLGAALTDLGHGVEIAGQCADAVAPVIADAAARHAIPVHAFKRSWSLAGQVAAARGMWGLVGRLASQARERGERLVVHNHGVWVLPVIAAAAAAHGSGVSSVISPHGMLRGPAMLKSAVKKRIVFQGIVRRQLVRATAVQATSAAEAEDLRRLVPGLDPVELPLGIVPPPAATKPRDATRPPAAGYLGRILPIKNLEGLLRAWAQAAPPQWRLRLAGPGDSGYVAVLRTLARELGIEDRVTIEPAVPHAMLGEFFAGLDLFILPSKSEAFSLTVGEALAAGVPAITTTAAPWAGVVAQGCGWCVAPDEPAIAHAIREATACDAGRLAAMGERGAAWIRNASSWTAIAKRHVDELYRRESRA